ncbi:DNA-binding protein [Paraliobacillus quinghaiensis]|uniref:DNA-binding protein n=1 Tax=Paraliobacillus quinghaiensis TaxID=470815 RepID=A0A917WQ38_9BACI|nr:RsfA family transcriptional regulator [Paraliobacillus quinghaiensis]GGM20514.1 DNA-binding protein [Paraliobacillus quinghaiensis]
MSAIRQDAWTNDEDILLAETVLRYIHDGKTQLEAFKEVGKRLARTPAACGFRWNASIRKQYQQEIDAAKKERKKQASEINYAPADEMNHQLTLEAAISILEKVKGNYDVFEKRKTIDYQQLHSLVEENNALKKQVAKYEETLAEMQKLWGGFDKLTY